MADEKYSSRPSRRTLLTASGGVGLAGVLGSGSSVLGGVTENLSPIGTVRAADAGGDKKGLTLLNDRPVNMETTAHLLDENTERSMESGIHLVSAFGI